MVVFHLQCSGGEGRRGGTVVRGQGDGRVRDGGRERTHTDSIKLNCSYSDESRVELSDEEGIFMSG